MHLDLIPTMRIDRDWSRLIDVYKRKQKIIPKCTCGNYISSNNATGRCNNCYLKYRRQNRPPCEILIAEIEKLGYAAVGRKYGVSDNAIRKWVRAL